MKEKKRKGIGCATILILLPIPGMIIYGLVTELVGDTLGDFANDSSGIMMNGKDVYNITVGNGDILTTGFNDLTAAFYDSSASALDESIDRYKKRKHK